MSANVARRLGALGPVVLLLACSTVVDGPSVSCAVSEVTLSPPTASLVTGSEITVGAFVKASNCTTGPTITWTTSSATVAAVANAGSSAIVSAVNPGTATITVTAAGEAGSAQATMTVVVSGKPVASVKVNPSSSTIQPGATMQFSAELRDAAGNLLNGRAVTWSSGATNVATVSSTGLVTGVGAGTAQITAQSELVSGNASVTVVTIPAASVSVAPSSSTIPAGQTVQLTATVRDQGGNVLTGRPVTWTSSTPAIASVDENGLVSGVSQGSVTITARAENAFGTADVSVGGGSDSDRMAWATIEGNGTPSVLHSFNGKSGSVFVTRRATGRYFVSFGNMGDPLGAQPGNAETVMLSPVGSPGRVCGLDAWTDVGSALQVNVDCADLQGTFADADFNVLVVGRGALTGSSAFLRTTTLAPQYTPDAKWAWNNEDKPMSVTLAGSSRTLDLGASSLTGAGYQVTLFNPASPAVCGPSAFATNSSLVSVRCFNPNGFPEDRLFTMLMVQGGRGTLPNARFGYATVDQPSAAQYQPAGSLARSSTGGAITVTKLATGQWRVRFGGLAGPANSEIAFVSQFGQPYAACFIESSVSAGADFDVIVRCTGADGLPLDHAFSLLVLE